MNRIIPRILRTIGIAVLVAATLTIPKAARGVAPCATWSTFSLLAPRKNPAMAYDAGRGVTVLFGGNNGASAADTWEWNGTIWTQRFPANSPPGRFVHAMAYDSARHVTVLFGGSNSGGLGDTWEWDGTNWTQRSPATSPAARLAHAMAYDSARGATVLFGGTASATYFSDTWELGVSCLNADMNDSCRGDGLDTAPFVAALLAASTAPSDLCRADFNANGIIDVGDVPGFTQKVLGL